MSSDKFHRIILPLKDKLFRLAWSIVKNNAEAEDIVQDVFVKLWIKRNEWDDINNIEGYCFRAVRNLAVDRVEKLSFKQTDIISQDSIKFEISDNRTPYTTILENENNIMLHRAIESLSTTQRMVFQLREIEGMSYKEIANTLELSEESIKVNLHRARNKIKDYLLNLM